MDYEIVKNISHNKKDDKIFITSVNSNVFNDYYNISPKYREKYDISIKEYQLNKELNKFQNIIKEEEL